jgi:hypothetical protein
MSGRNTEAVPSARSCGALEPVAVGIDSLYLSSFLDGVGIDWESLRFEQEKLRATPGAEFVEFELGGERFALKRGGRKPYSFILKNKAFELQLGENINPRCYAQFSSELLWGSGFDGALARYRALWHKAGTGVLRNDVITRIDTAFDFAIGVAEFDANHFVSRANKDSIHRENRKAQTFQFGRSDIVCRVYDKVAEIEQQSGKTWLYDIWGTEEGVWRCEFQIRSPALRNAGIATIEQCRAHLPELVRYLAESHTSLRIPNDDSNRSRWPPHPMWNGLIDAADRLVAPPLSPPSPLMEGTDYLLDRQVQSLYGDLKGIASVLSRKRPDDPITLEELLDWLPGRLGRHHCSPLWKNDVCNKVRKRELGL